MSRRRSFNQFERNEIYRRSEGLCGYCFSELDEVWWPDHVIPFSKGGETSIANGIACCEPCNRKKGNKMPDKISLRPFQQQMLDVVRTRILDGKRSTMAWVGPGSGKTIAWLSIANFLYRDGLIKASATFVPRLSLKAQAETDCNQYIGLCEKPVIGGIVGKGNVEPLVRSDKFGYIATYQSLVMDKSEIHLNWAKKNAKKFLLVLDEAQFVGVKDDCDNGGTLVAGSVAALASYALHTIVMTGTPARSDGGAIVLAEYDSEADEIGIRNLKHDIRSTYMDGVVEKYLRPCFFSLSNGNGTLSNNTEFKISALEESDASLGMLLRKREIWEYLVDKAVEYLIERRRVFIGYKGLIAAVDQTHAKDIHEYIKRRHRNFNAVVAISDEDGSHEVMNDFRPKSIGGADRGDILVTVGMAYVGYNCPSITVVGMLTNKRYEGWLEQTAMRGGRVWSERPVDEQWVIVVAPNDKRMREFADNLRSASEAGLKYRDSDPVKPSSLGLFPPTASDIYVNSAEISDEEGMGLNEQQDINAEQMAGIKTILPNLSSPMSPVLAAELFRAAGYPIPTARAETYTKQKTNEEIRKETSKYIGWEISRYVQSKIGIDKNMPEHQSTVALYRGRLNARMGVRNVNELTDNQLNEVLRMAKEMNR